MAASLTLGTQGAGRSKGVRYELRKGTAPIFNSIEARMREGASNEGGRIVAYVMRHGRGSVGEQFAREREESYSGTRAWPKTKAFGNRPAPAKTLVRTGALRAAWKGGAGSVTRARRSSVVIGVDTAQFPQAGVFQRSRVTVVRAKRPGARGRSKMGWYLGMVLGVWISDKTLYGRGLRIRPRRVRVNRAMAHRAVVALREWFITGNAQAARNL